MICTVTHASRKGKVFYCAREVLEFCNALCAKKQGKKENVFDGAQEVLEFGDALCVSVY